MLKVEKEDLRPKKQLDQHLVLDKLRSERIKYEPIWGRDTWWMCAKRALGQLILDMFSRSFALTLGSGLLALHYIQTSSPKPSWPELTVLLVIPVCFGLYWMEKTRGAALWEAITYRIREGKDGKV